MTLSDGFGLCDYLGLTLNNTLFSNALSFLSCASVAVALRNQKVTVSNGASKVIQVSSSVTIPTLQEFTVCFEIARASLKNKEGIFSYAQQANNNGNNGNVALSFGRTLDGMVLLTDTETCVVDSILNATDITSTMKPFCLTWTSTTGKVAVYYNDNYREKICSNMIAHSPVGAGGTFRLGDQNSFDGTVYNFRLWDYAMSAAQLASLPCEIVGNVIDWDNGFWDIPSSLAQTDSALSCSTSGPVYPALSTSCTSPGLGCPATSSSATTTSMSRTTSTITVTQSIIPSAAASTNTPLFYITTNASEATTTSSSKTNTPPATMFTNIIAMEKERAVYLWSLLRLTPRPVAPSTNTTSQTRLYVLPGPRNPKTSLGYISTPLIWPVRKRPVASLSRPPDRPVLYLTKPPPVPGTLMPPRSSMAKATAVPVSGKTTRTTTSPQALSQMDVENLSDEIVLESFPAAASSSLGNRKKNKPVYPPHWVSPRPSRDNSSSVNWTEPLEEYTSGLFIYDLDLGDDSFSVFQYDSTYSLDEGLAQAASGPPELSPAERGLRPDDPDRVTASSHVTDGGIGKSTQNQSDAILPGGSLAPETLAESGGEAWTREPGGEHSSRAQMSSFSTAPERTGAHMDHAGLNSGVSEQTAGRANQSLTNIDTQPSLLSVAESGVSRMMEGSSDKLHTGSPTDCYTQSPTPTPTPTPTVPVLPQQLQPTESPWTSVISVQSITNSLPSATTRPPLTPWYGTFLSSPTPNVKHGSVIYSGHVRPSSAADTKPWLQESSQVTALQPSMEVQSDLFITRPSPPSATTDAAAASLLEKTHLPSSDKRHGDLVLPSLRNQLSSFSTNSHSAVNRFASTIPEESTVSETGSQSDWLRLYSTGALEPLLYMNSVPASSEEHDISPVSSDLRGWPRTPGLFVTPITDVSLHQDPLPAAMTDRLISSQSSAANTISQGRQKSMEVFPTVVNVMPLSSVHLTLPEQLHITRVTEWETPNGRERHSVPVEDEVRVSPISSTPSSPPPLHLLRSSVQQKLSESQHEHHRTSRDVFPSLSQTRLLSSFPMTLVPTPARPAPQIENTASEYDGVISHEPLRRPHTHEFDGERPVGGMATAIHTATHTPLSVPRSAVTSRSDKPMSDTAEYPLSQRPVTISLHLFGEGRPLQTPPVRVMSFTNTADSRAGASLPTQPTAAFQQSATLTGSQSEPTRSAVASGELAWPGKGIESTMSPPAPDTQLTVSDSGNHSIGSALIQPTAVTTNIQPASVPNAQPDTTPFKHLTAANEPPTVFPNIYSTSIPTSRPPKVPHTYPAGAGPVMVLWSNNHSEDPQDDKHRPAPIDHTSSAVPSPLASSVGLGNESVNQNITDRETTTHVASTLPAVKETAQQSFVPSKSPNLSLTTPHRVQITNTIKQLCTFAHEGHFYRISFVVNDMGTQLTESDVAKTVSQWLNETFQNWTHVVFNNVSIHPYNDVLVKRSVNKKYTCQTLLDYRTTTNVTLGEAAISTRMMGSASSVAKGLQLDTFTVQSVENCPADSLPHYSWPDTQPTATYYIPCFPNKDQKASRTCVISYRNYTAYWDTPDLRNCTNIADIAVSAENAAEVAVQLADITNNELSTDEVSKVVGKVKELVTVAKINSTLATTVVSIISNVMDSSVFALAVASERTLKTVDELVQKIEFDGPSMSITSKNLALGISAFNHSEFNGTSFSAFLHPTTTDIQIDFKSDQQNPLAQVSLPATLLKDLTLTDAEMGALSRINFMFFNKTGLFQDKPDGLSLISYVVASSVANYSINNLQDPVKIEITHLNYLTKPKPTCMFWDFTMKNGTGGWNSKGCRVGPMSNTIKTICLCDHLTHFGILMDISGSAAQIDAKNNQILTFITYIGCGISAIFSAATLLTYIAFEKLRRDYPSKILMNLSTSLLFLNMVFLLDGWLASFDMEGLCVAVAIFLHFFLLTSFTWMGLESIHMYIALVKVFNTYIRRYILKFCIVGWGLPAAIVAIVVAIDKKSYGTIGNGKGEAGQGSSAFCWVQSKVVFYVTCVGYFSIIFLMNVAMFIVVMIQICGRNGKRSNRTLRDEVLRNLRSVVSLTFLLGMTWGFALFAWGPVSLAFMYLFTIFNSLQGLFIFIFHCALKENVQKQWRRYLCCGRFRLADNSDLSKTATNNTKKVSSDAVGKSNSSSSFSSSTANWTSKAKATLNPFAKRKNNADVVHQ
ncbi:hypothetical protein DPEC_G00085240 [Dallia pectoralis]|uniref:Uncharacterized protein n=1 Tax=Dallia pectoralis TaxID=75939 RepID=A0ACC2GZ81_DALPE|nr:hypothetical protein DPEC_G00085240 [Dallia pectoralis]